MADQNLIPLIIIFQCLNSLHLSQRTLPTPSQRQKQIGPNPRVFPRSLTYRGTTIPEKGTELFQTDLSLKVTAQGRTTRGAVIQMWMKSL